MTLSQLAAGRWPATARHGSGKHKHSAEMCVLVFTGSMPRVTARRAVASFCIGMSRSVADISSRPLMLLSALGSEGGASVKSVDAALRLIRSSVRARARRFGRRRLSAAAHRAKMSPIHVLHGG